MWCSDCNAHACVSWIVYTRSEKKRTHKQTISYSIAHRGNVRCTKKLNLVCFVMGISICYSFYHDLFVLSFFSQFVAPAICSHVAKNFVLADWKKKRIHLNHSDGRVVVDITTHSHAQNTNTHTHTRNEPIEKKIQTSMLLAIRPGKTSNRFRMSQNFSANSQSHWMKPSQISCFNCRSLYDPMIWYQSNWRFVVDNCKKWNFTYEVFSLLFLTVSHLYWNKQHRHLSLVKKLQGCPRITIRNIYTHNSGRTPVRCGFSVLAAFGACRYQRIQSAFFRIQFLQFLCWIFSFSLQESFVFI